MALEVVSTFLSAMVAAGRLTTAVPSLLRDPLDSPRARAALAERLATRQASFLSLVRRGVYEHLASPYRALLRGAGCELGDLQALVRERGVEGALAVLFQHGVYLSVDEFKGRRPMVRGSTTVAVDPSALRNPVAAAHVPFQSGGSRAGRTDVWLDAAFLRERAGNVGLVFQSRGDGGPREYAIWLVPGGAVIVHVLEFALFGTPHRHWFSQLDPASRRLASRYRWSDRLVRAAALGAGVRLPRPRYVPLDDPRLIAHWMADTLRAGRRPVLWTFASSAVRLCQSAAEAGLDLTGAEFGVGGEPFTEARRAAIQRVGGEAYPQYGVSECGEIGFACLDPRALDEIHVFDDLHALVQPGPEGPARGLPSDGLFISSLRPTAPFILLNVSMGDRGTLGVRDCGCAMARLGWTTHLQALHSDEKVTAAGMTFDAADIFRVLEVTLPERFGGGPDGLPACRG
jgi:hypothetical protein